MTFYISKLVEIQVENSSICNAACPQCVREIISPDKSWLNETYLETDFFNRIPDHIYQDLKIFFFCGNLGDPCAAPNFLDVCRLVRSKNPNMIIKISTNGGLRSTSFWKELATILGDKSEVVFAIDGLKDTNHIYRVNVRWSTVISNAKAFISAGGKPNWQFIAFKHNQHQVEEARKYAKELGFAKFIVKPSHRFALDGILGIDRQNKTSVKIEPPDDQTLVHKVVLHKTAKNFRELKEQSDSSKITCHVKHTYSSVYIDHLGRMWPCCYLAAGLYVSQGYPVPDGWLTTWNNYGDHRVNLKNHNWDDILNGDFFNTIENSWDKDYDNGRIMTCSITCSDFQSRVNIPVEANRISENA